MAPILIIIYLISALIILAIGITVARWLHRRGGWLLAVPGLVASLAALVLAWPIPIHGGFMFLGEAMYHEWSRERHRQIDQVAAQKKADRVAALSERFAGVLPLSQQTPLNDGWDQVLTESGTAGWLDRRSGLIWSDWLVVGESDTLPALEPALARCANVAPPGYWALASEAEQVTAWLHDGATVLSPAPGASLSYSHDVERGTRWPAYQLRGSDNRGGGASRQFHARCVARTRDAPPGGYTRRDIPLDEWNRYQLAKSGG